MVPEYEEHDDEIVPPNLRKPIWRIYSILGLIIGATAVGYSTAVGADNLPVWLTVTTAVYTFLGGPLGFLAQRNVR